MQNPNCPHCGAKNCRRIHENAEVVNLDTKKKVRADIYKCKVCWKEHAQPPVCPVAPAETPAGNNDPMIEEPSSHTTTPFGELLKLYNEAAWRFFK